MNNKLLANTIIKSKNNLKLLFAKLHLIKFIFWLYELLRSINMFGRYRNKFNPNNSTAKFSPPKFLIVKVTGKNDLDDFIASGLDSFIDITSILESNGLWIDDFKKVLDFGCGAGRVAINFKNKMEIDFYGSDINPQAINWCKKNLGFGKYNVNKISPPTNYQDNYFELIYALSVFTHLSEQLQIGWMREFYRILKKGGYIIITTHGKKFYNRLESHEMEIIEAEGYYARFEENSGSNLCVTYNKKEHLENTIFKDFFTIVDYKPGGSKGNGGQDIYLLKKNAD